MHKMTFCWLLCLLCSSAASACIFDTSGLPGNDVDGSGRDAPVDGSVSLCTPDQSYCEGRVLQTCNAEGTGPVAGAEQICDFTCAGSACVYASNMPADVYEACDGTAPALTPPAGATVRFIEPGAVARIVCTPHCGDESVTFIDAIYSAAGPDRAWFCLSSLELPGDALVTYDTSLEEAVILLVDSTVEIASTIDFRGGDAMGTTAGAGGPGGGAGGAFSTGAGNTGLGACGGQGGRRQGESGHYAGGGGGGNGHGVTSGDIATGGAGGGGSGGAIVLESPAITMDGALLANGGDGGTGAGGPGGAGASGTTPDGAMGASHQDEAQGGSGGGGGGGRIRINTPGAALACGAFASPQPICTSGDLATSPQ
jgi:hypothetical protein